MLIKKYKAVKSTSISLILNRIIKNSSFFCFLQTKQLNHSEWLMLKRAIYPIGLNIFVCKNAFLNLRNVLPNLPNNIRYNLKQGNLIILYSENNTSFPAIYEFFSSDLLLKKMKISPLIFYFLSRFLLPKNFIQVCKASKYDAFCRLIYILKYRNYDMVNRLSLANRILLSTLSSKQVNP